MSNKSKVISNEHTCHQQQCLSVFENNWCLLSNNLKVCKQMNDIFKYGIINRTCKYAFVLVYFMEFLLQLIDKYIAELRS